MFEHSALHWLSLHEVFNFNSSVFGNSAAPLVSPTAKVVFVSDMFVEDYVGGAELTSQALIDSAPFEVSKLHSRHLTMKMLEENRDKFWVFGNFAQMNPQLIPSIVANVRYSILEYDYKYCKHRSPEKHLAVEGLPCDCHNQMNGKLISAFFFGSMHVWWMSEKQRERYITMFPFLNDRDNTVLSSVFDDRTLATLKLLREQNIRDQVVREKWLVLESNSWIKGTAAAKEWCDSHGKSVDIINNVKYEDLLARMSHAEGLAYLPPGGDTCPRLVIEAKLLGCQLHLNENVQHKDEEWFNTDDLGSIEEYLYTARSRFWNGIKHAMEFRASVSGYTTTLNCVKQQYPFEQCIKSMLEFCDEVCVVDGGSTDGTWERLQVLAGEYTTRSEPEVNRLKLKQVKRDWKHPRFAVFDGMQKAEARKMCTKDFCWQMDSDEIVHEDDAPKILELCRAMAGDMSIVSLPVVEYWGGEDKVRMDVLPWKWRLSRNNPDITHGIPIDLRTTDAQGNACAKPGTDGCDMISASTGERLPHLSFYAPEVDNIRKMGLVGVEQAREQYEAWFNQAVNTLPGVFHYSWFDLERKIKLYRDYWTAHWCSLEGRDYIDTAETNMMFDVPWSQVTDEMISERVIELQKTGGHIWHSKWSGGITPWIKCHRSQPKFMVNPK